MATFNYKAETFKITVDDKEYNVNTSKLFLIVKLRDICEKIDYNDSSKIFLFFDEVYNHLRLILGEETFKQIFAERMYDIVFLSEFCVYLSTEAAPTMGNVYKRFDELSKKYGAENINEPVNSQIAR